ncbi:hypothetical protein M422DRAFT_35938, partial [Sphaerobolus stellatus SS14]
MTLGGETLATGESNVDSQAQTHATVEDTQKQQVAPEKDAKEDATVNDESDEEYIPRGPKDHTIVKIDKKGGGKG